ncbi:MAG: hypothetical protein H8E86_06535 [Planctomycetes bacterium]|nr:hypothetical protein [Planctomycetota bacterium]
MRSDRGTTFATILVLMCCIGGNVGSGSMSTHRVLIRTVVQHGNVSFIEVGTPSHSMGLPATWKPQILDGNLLPLADIDELHNLPPPYCG